MISTLIIMLLFHDAKAEALARWPAYAAQINQVAMPSIGYRNRIWFDRQLRGFALGKCDPFGRPQIWVVRDELLIVTAGRLYHELRHFIAFAAGLPLSEHRRIDSS